MKAMVLALGVAAVLAAVVGLSLTLSPGGGGEVQAQGASPAVPANVRAENGVEPGQAVVTWDAVNAAAFYRIGWVNMETFWAVQAEGGRQWLDVFAFLDVVNRGQTSQTLYELAPGVEYAFIVASVGQRFGEAAGWTDWTYLVTTAPPPLSCPVNTTGTPTAPGGSGAPTPTATPTPMPRATATPAPTTTPIPTPTPTITAQTPGQDGAGHWFYPTPTPTARPTVAVGSGAGGGGAAVPTPTPTAGPVANVLDPTPTARPTATATPAPTATPTPAPTATATPAPTPTPTLAPTPTSATDSVAGDRAALDALRNAAARGGRHNLFGNTPVRTQTRPLGELPGVTTDDNGRVTRLDLNGASLYAIGLPAELGNLSKLTYLDLRYNRFIGTIPAELGNLSKLTHLYFGCNTSDGEYNECQYFWGCIPAGLSDVPNNDLSNLGLPYCN